MSTDAANKAPRCQAHTTAGNPCKKAAMRDKTVCRTHGGAAGRPPEHGMFSEAAKTWPTLAERIISILESPETDRHLALLAQYEAALEVLAEQLRGAELGGHSTCPDCEASVPCKTCSKVAPIERYMKALAQAQFLHTELAKKQQFLASVIATETVNRVLEVIVKILNDELTPGQLVKVLRALSPTQKLPLAELS